MKRETWPLTFHSSFVICLLSEHILTVQQDFTDVELAFDEPVSIALGERGAIQRFTNTTTKEEGYAVMFISNLLL